MKANTMIVDKYAAFVVNSSEVKKNSLTDPLCRDKKIPLIGNSVRSKFFLKPAESALRREGNLDFYGSFVGSVLKIPGTI